MDIQKLVALASIASTASKAGLQLIGGAKALAALFGHDLTASEQLAIEVHVMADAQRRLGESERMAGIV